jgi:hypothetical protein
MSNTQPSGGTLAPAAASGAVAASPANSAAKGSALPGTVSAPPMSFRVKPLERTGPPTITAECTKGPSMPNMHGGTHGSGGTLSNNVLRYTDDQTKKAMTFAVIRPAYVARQNQCNHLEGDTGLWMWIAAGGTSGYLFGVGVDGSVSIFAVNATQIGELTR